MGKEDERTRRPRWEAEAVTGSGLCDEAQSLSSYSRPQSSEL